MFSKVYPTAVEVTPNEKLAEASPVVVALNHGENLTPLKEMERRIIIKTDLHVLPILFLLFLVSFIDRTNIGNAKIEGLTTDLQMTGNQYNIAVLVFNIPYVLLDVPSNLLLRRSRPNRMISGMMFGWGKLVFSLSARDRHISKIGISRTKLAQVSVRLGRA